MEGILGERYDRKRSNKTMGNHKNGYEERGKEWKSRVFAPRLGYCMGKKQSRNKLGAVKIDNRHLATAIEPYDGKLR